MKYFGCSWDEVIWGMTWYQIMTLSATIPKYKGKEDGKPQGEEIPLAALFGSPGMPPHLRKN